MSALHRLCTRLLAIGLALVIMATLGALNTARADTVGAHLATAHTGSSSADFRAATPGLYWRGDSGLTLGAYRNSIGQDSVYAAWTWQTDDQRWAVTAGVVGGYVGGAAPLLIPSVRLPAGPVALRLALIPPVKRISGGGGVHVAIEWEL